MSRTGRGHGPNPRPVTHIELPEKHIPLRIALMVGFLVIGIACIGAALSGWLGADPGWQVVEPSVRGMSLSQDFTLMYDFDAAGNPTAERKAITTVYSAALQDAYYLFSPRDAREGERNLAYLNAHPNETVEVDPGLYRAIALLAEYDDRHVFLAPVTVEYDRVLTQRNELEAAQYIPRENPETMAWIGQLVRYINDPQSIRLEALGENRVRLTVSEAYLAFARENEIDILLDLGWMGNAFAADYLAQALTDAGYTRASLSSRDGFLRNLDTRPEGYRLNLYDRKGTAGYHAATVGYTPPAAVVNLRDFPLSQDRWTHFAFSDGTVVTALIDPADGLDKSSVHTLTVYGQGRTCGEVLLETVDLFIADTFDEAAAGALAEEGIHCLWFRGNTLYYTDGANVPQPLQEGETYTVKRLDQIMRTE